MSDVCSSELSTVTAGAHSVGETAGTSTSLGDYTTSISCNDPLSTSGTGTSLAVNVASNQNIICTITNTRSPGTLTVVKHVVSSANPETGKFNLQIDGSTAGTGANDGDAGTTDAPTVTAGAHHRHGHRPN